MFSSRPGCWPCCHSHQRDQRKTPPSGGVFDKCLMSVIGPGLSLSNTGRGAIPIFLVAFNVADRAWPARPGCTEDRVPAAARENMVAVTPNGRGADST